MAKETKKPTLSRPKDQTWQSFRSWFLSVASNLLGRPAEDRHTDEEWQQLAKKFWESVDNNSAGQND